MATSTHDKVSLRGFHFEDWSLTFNLNSATAATDVGKAMSIDTSGPNKAKLAADGDIILGRLATYEDRTVEGIKVGAIELKFANLLPFKSGETPAAGDTVVGAGSGEVKVRKVSTVATPDYNDNFVAEVIGTNVVVVKR